MSATIIENEAPDLRTFFTWPEKGREVRTVRGVRILRKVTPDPIFWESIWSRYRYLYSNSGFSASENLQRKGVWELCWWQPLDETEIAKREANKVLSRAATTDFEPPKPAGCEYMPFQKAGIEFVLRVWEDL